VGTVSEILLYIVAIPIGYAAGLVLAELLWRITH
jgi:hypothetical protein